MSKPTLLVIGHVAELSLDRLQESADAHGLALQVVRPALGEPLPADPEEHVGVVVLGGPQSAYHIEQHTYLADEVDFIASAHRAGVAILGICLGSQLLAVALGGEALPGDGGLEYGFIDVTPIGEVGDDVAGRHFSFHSDTFRLPEGATLLAVTDRYPQAWRLDNSLALQFHPELDRAGVEALLDVEDEKLTRFGIDLDILRKENAEEMRAPHDGVRLIDRWIARHAVRPDHFR